MSVCYCTGACRATGTCPNSNLIRPVTYPYTPVTYPQYFPPRNPISPPSPQVVIYPQPGVSEERLREIIREELERAK